MNENEERFFSIDLYTNSLYPGMLLKGDLFTEQGIKIYPANQPVTQDVIDSLLSQNIKKVFYKRPLIVPRNEKNPMIPFNVLEKAFSIAEQIGYAIIKKTPLPEKDIEETVEQFIEKIANADSGAMLNILEIKDYDEQTYVHSVNVTMLAVLFSKLMEWKRNKIRVLGIGALLHDIGKILVPLEILNKKELLSKEEFDIIKKHPVYGYNILKSQSQFEDQIINITLMHHECFDGSGYPLGVTSEKIDDMAQIVSLCDFYEAVTTNKIYRDKIAFWRAFLMIRTNMAVKFNPRFAIEFINKMPKYLIEKSIFSIGQYVLLNTGEKAEVVRLSKVEALKPVVSIYYNSKGDILKYPLQIDLVNDDTRWIETIIEDKETNDYLDTLKKADMK